MSSDHETLFLHDSQLRLTVIDLQYCELNSEFFNPVSKRGCLSDKYSVTEKSCFFSCGKSTAQMDFLVNRTAPHRQLRISCYRVISLHRNALTEITANAIEQFHFYAARAAIKSKKLRRIFLSQKNHLIPDKQMLCRDRRK